MKKKLLVYILFVIALTLISCLSLTELDGIWGYGFSYNIANGLIPYRDYNMVVGPFYSVVLSLFIKIFGNYFVVFALQNSLIYAVVFYFVYKKIGLKSIYVLLLLGCCLTSFGYNTFCAILVVAILVLLDSKNKYKDVIIGILIGIIIMTKHNIGGCLALVYFFTSENKIKAILSILIPVIPTLIYLIINNALYAYLDFCIFGLGNFLDNLYIDIFSIPILIIMLYFLIKDYKETKNIKLLYIFAFMIILFPILDQGHICPAMLPVSYYLLTKENSKIQFYFKMFVSIGFVVSVLISPLLTSTVSFKDNYLKFQRMNKALDNYLEGYDEYLDKNSDKKVYLFIDNAYLVKLYRDETLTFWDLINNGNLGKDEKKYVNLVDEDCKNKKCLFILDQGYFKPKLIGIQRSPLFKEYVLENAEYLETLPSGDRIYINFSKN